MALISNGNKRSARIMCITDCHLAVLDKIDFDSILKKREEEKLMKKMIFFLKIDVFNGWAF